MEIVFSPKSTQNIREIQEYSKEYPLVFAKIIERFNTCLKIIKHNPHLGKLGRKEGTYEFFVSNTNYFIVYRVLPSTIEVVAVLHTSRRY